MNLGTFSHGAFCISLSWHVSSSTSGWEKEQASSLWSLLFSLGSLPVAFQHHPIFLLVSSSCSVSSSKLMTFYVCSVPSWPFQLEPVHPKQNPISTALRSVSLLRPLTLPWIQSKSLQVLRLLLFLESYWKQITWVEHLLSDILCSAFHLHDLIHFTPGDCTAAVVNYPGYRWRNWGLE